MLKLVGAVAAGLAIGQGALACLRWLRQVQVRTHLGGALRRFIRLDRRLAALVAELTWRLNDGVGWAGWSLWPEPLEGRLTYMEALIDELEHDVAQVRGLSADAGLERLRSDIESLGDLLRRAFTAYLEGTIGTYQQSEGKPIEQSPTGRGVVAAAGTADTDQLAELRRQVRLLARSAAYQMKEEGWVRGLLGEWAIFDFELPEETDHLWRGEPRPFD